MDTIPKLRTPDYPEVEQRRPLSKWEFATLFLAQQGKCAQCSARLEKGKVRDEHLHALNLGGGNELTNRALWCLDCTKPKDVMDKARIAKSKRIRGETCNGPRQKIKSRGFAKGIRRKMDGTIVKVGQ
jgi:5-methylcytosine-specific restriction endonuclease McrA